MFLCEFHFINLKKIQEIGNRKQYKEINNKIKKNQMDIPLRNSGFVMKLSEKKNKDLMKGFCFLTSK